MATSTEHELAEIYQKVEAGARLSRADGFRLIGSGELVTLGRMADLARARASGDQVYFTHSLNINPSNVCLNRCPLCAFARSEGEEEAYCQSLEEVEAQVETSRPESLTEVHIVGGLHPRLRLDYFVEMLRRIRSRWPHLHIQGLTAVEIDHLAGLEQASPQAVLEALKTAGLGSLPGGGAEIFDPQVRARICPHKISAERWLEIHREAHLLGLPSNATMLFGHLESPEHQVEHMIRLRELQDQTGGFRAFVPLAFHSANTGLEGLPGPTGFDQMKVYACGRLLLDNFPHLRALWTGLGPKLAQTSLFFGVDDLGGTSLQERIVRAAGVDGDQALSSGQMASLIRSAGRVPVLTDSAYQLHREVAP